MSSLRQIFLNGSLTRFLDADTVLRNKIVEVAGAGDFGLASGQKPDGSYECVWCQEPVVSYEVAFEPEVFLLTKARAEVLMVGPPPAPEPEPEPELDPVPVRESRTLRLMGNIPPELWNRLGMKVLPKLRAGTDLQVGVDSTVSVRADLTRSMEAELRQWLEDLRLTGRVNLE